MVHITEEQYARAFKLSRVGQHLILAYEDLQTLGKPDALAVLMRAIQELRQLIPNAFPATYDAD